MFRCIALLLTIAIVPTGFAAGPRTYVLEPGVYESIVIGDGEMWLGVFPAGARATVKEKKIRVRKVASDDAAEGMAIRVDTASGGNEPLFMLKGSTRVKPGDVNSVYLMSDDPPSAIQVTLQGKKYVIHRVKAKGADGAPVQRLTLKLGDKQIVLGECPARDGIFPVWAGDLDGDGRLDLYVRIEHHNYWTEQLLFLSSADATGKALTSRAAKLLIKKLE